MAADILVVDDEADIRDLISGILDDEGYSTRLASDSDTALAEIENRVPSLVVLDIWLQGSRLDGLQILERIKQVHPELPVVIISGHGNVETAVAAIKRGAYDFIEKPFKADKLVLNVHRALETAKLRRENTELKMKVGTSADLVGESSAVSQVRQIVERVAPTNSRVLIVGPPGCGKEVAARLMHAKSRRAHGPFIAINAATIAPDRMEVELFGVEESGDQSHKVGVFEQAHGGTLYLDEIADMPIETQSKILRVLVEQNFERVGGGTKVQVDVRVMSSTSRDLRAAIDEGTFREDLYHRLNVVPLQIPALADRREDIPDLVEHFMGQLTSSSGLPTRRIGEDALAALQAHDWPGNVRQLRNIVERLLILATQDVEDVITADLLPAEVGQGSPALAEGGRTEHIISLPLREAREAFEREYLMAQIKRFGGNISRTASFIGMERSALHRKLKSLGVNTSSRSSSVNA